MAIGIVGDAGVREYKRVFCRCRPLNLEEIAIGASMATDFESTKDGELMVKANGAPKKLCNVSIVAEEDVESLSRSDNIGLLEAVIETINACLAEAPKFGLSCPAKSLGVNYITLEELFCTMHERYIFRDYTTMKFLLEIRQVTDGVHHVLGLVEAHVNNMNEVWEVLQTGSTIAKKTADIGPTPAYLNKMFPNDRMYGRCGSNYRTCCDFRSNG
ncbi:hypothetical protein IFM89_020996 [Coptis chinensis]|uniref:Uncharacterized protein n=1 Tax=Coptis chinensis TaxID=261450 RepID=A0A835H4D0_9MAGN|nr:hypothetical protein IFM89_020996 [Coptis chinensis]